MKLNAAATLFPITWPQFSQLHPFAPQYQTVGSRKLVDDLSRYLEKATSFYAVSLQPNSGATGEYAGLKVIVEYLRSVGEGHRKICLIPRGAHGTNPASAAAAGLKVKAVSVDQNGNMDLNELRNICNEFGKDIACIMTTYPSTHGVFDEGIREVCKIVHAAGAQVYMDGANMNAQIGLMSPGDMGADVCHMNLHKTFAIPHGGGGPGVGPIACAKHLAPFLPGHCVSRPDAQAKGQQISAAQYGSAMILPIPWMYITMLGSLGLQNVTKNAILNANYMLRRLREHYHIGYVNKNGRCGHEFIIDVSSLADAGVKEEDVAKRLSDYGFHAPTVSWPVPKAIMPEPTESENKGELDRFCDAMISIKKEYEMIKDGSFDKADNPLKNAPHPVSEVSGSEWKHGYSREAAAYPNEWIAKRGKFWPSSARVDNIHGDKVLICSLRE
eukprot:Filipodium_phascolosomae@DN2457_c0_g1_i2.p1